MLDVRVIDAHAVALAALDGLSDGVLVVADGEVLVANGAAHRLTGHAAGELTGGPAPEWVATAAARGGAIEVALPGRDGRRRRATVTVAPCPLPGGDVARLVTVHDRSAEAAREAELVRQAHRDGLTGLLNHRSFTARLAEEAERLSARGRPLGLVVVDLDHFKAVNDEHGHPVGDRVLAEAAQRIAAEARAIDSVGRIGGEEFAWLLPDASAGETLAAAERVRAAMRARPFAHGLALTASIGVCDLASASDAATLMERADQALYWAKAHGRDAALRWTAATASAAARRAGCQGRRTSGSTRSPASPTRPTRRPPASSPAPPRSRRSRPPTSASTPPSGRRSGRPSSIPSRRAGCATITSAGTAPATPTALPASTSPTARGSSRSPTRGTR